MKLLSLDADTALSPWPFRGFALIGRSFGCSSSRRWTSAVLNSECTHGFLF